jgi:ABC-type phosphate transport system substrate-binding protein
MLKAFKRTCAVFLLLSTAAMARDIAVIVSKSSPNKTVTAADLSKIAKGATKKWPDGQEIVIVMRDPGTPEMKTVNAKIFNQSPEEVKAAVNGNKKVYVVMGSNEDVVKAVAATPGAVGLVDVYSINGSVTVVKVDGKLPLEPGYLLHGQ